ncbi:MAG: hypothetical protein KIT84_38420 [Labilithrix sp.]|nr:hypothetical protein [Labilithrix sp.]
MPGCALVVGIQDLGVAESKDSEPPPPPPPPEAGPLEPRDAAVFDQYVPPDVDAGCTLKSKGPLVPSTSRDTGNGMGWNFPERGRKADGEPTYILAIHGTTSKRILFGGFQVGLAPTDKVKGIVFEQVARANEPLVYFDVSVQLTLPGEGPAGDDRPRSDPYPVDFDNRVFGGPTDLWGLDAKVTPAALNSLEFGVSFVIRRKDTFKFDSAMGIDGLQMTVYYCE